MPEGQRTPLDELANLTLDEYLEGCYADLEEDRDPVLIFDQFEELFTLVADDPRAGFIGFIETIVGLPQVRVLATKTQKTHE